MILDTDQEKQACTLVTLKEKVACLPLYIQIKPILFKYWFVAVVQTNHLNLSASGFVKLLFLCLSVCESCSSALL